jgi:hypothetical protein
VADETPDTLEEGANRGHSRFAPSSAEGWMNCDDYILANTGKADTAGIYAAEGTAFHTVMDRWIDSGMCCHEPGDIETVEAGGERFDIEVTEEMLAHANDCARHILALATEATGQGGEYFTETRVDFSDLMPIADQGGTCDFAAVSPGKLAIRDYKYGKGIRVDAADNPQLMLYAYGAFRLHDLMYDIQTISIGILQPRLDHFDVVEISRAELLDFAEVVRVRAASAWAALKAGGRQRVPTPKGCMWCKDKARCAARASLLEQIADDSFENVEPAASQEMMAATKARIDNREFAPRLVPAGEMTITQLGRILTYRKDVEKWFKAIEAELLERALEGEDVEGWKIVTSRTHRKWTDPHAAEKLFIKAGLKWNDFWEMDAITPAAAIKLLKGKGIKEKDAEALLEPVMLKPPGNRTLAPASDKRAGIASAADEFEDVSTSSDDL